jgi:hypothetical protein
MQRAERKNAQREGRAARGPQEINLLLMVDDEARQGALRFAQQPGGSPMIPTPPKICACCWRQVLRWAARGRKRPCANAMVSWRSQNFRTRTVGVGDPAASLEIAMAEAKYFGLSTGEAKRTAGVVGAAVSGWRKEADALEMNKAAIVWLRRLSTPNWSRRFGSTQVCSN